MEGKGGVGREKITHQFANWLCHVNVSSAKLLYVVVQWNIFMLCITS